MYWYLKVLKQWDDFNGRARRKEFWMFFLFYGLFLLVAMLLDEIFETKIGDAGIIEFYMDFFFLFLLWLSVLDDCTTLEKAVGGT